MEEIKKNLSRLVLLLLLGLPTLSALGQSSKGWDILADVVFEEQYDEQMDGYWLIPNFGKQPRAHQNKPLVLEGYFIPIDMEDGFYVLSKFPYTSCFFCGGAGAETVVELDIGKAKVSHIRMDQKMRFSGTLNLNRTDFNHCNYILKNAKLLSP